MNTLYASRAGWLLVMLCISSPASALKISYSAALEVENTDNSTRAPASSAQSDTLLTTKLSAATSESEGPLTYRLGSSWRNVQYSDRTFADQDYLDIDFSSNWLLWNRRLDLRIRESLSQRRIDSLGVDTPDNVQNTNVFSISPLTSMRVSRRFQLQVVPTLTRNYFETTGNNNTTQSLGINWVYALYRTMNLTLSYNTDDVDYDDPAIFDTEFNNTSLSVAVSRRRSNISVSLGNTEVNRAGINTDGSSSSLLWNWNTTGASSFRFSYRSQLTDQSSRVLIGTFDDDGNLVDIDLANLTDVFRDKGALLRYSYSKAWLDASITLDTSEQDYSGTANDRENRSLNLSLSRPLRSDIRATLGIRQSTQEVPASGREDDRSSVNLSVSWNISRELRLRSSIKLEERDSTIDTNDYDETAVMVSLRYGVSR